MPMPRPLLQKTINYIASVCMYHDEKHGLINLTKSHQRRLAQTLLFVVSNHIDNKTNEYAIGRGNHKLDEFFADLEKEHIVFPKAGFLLYSSGVSYQRSNRKDVELVNLKKSIRVSRELIDAARREIQMPTLEKVLENGLIDKLAKLEIKSTKTDQTCNDEKGNHSSITPIFSGLRKQITLADFLSPHMKTYFGIKLRTSM